MPQFFPIECTDARIRRYVCEQFDVIPISPTTSTTVCAITAGSPRSFPEVLPGRRPRGLVLIVEDAVEMGELLEYRLRREDFLTALAGEVEVESHVGQGSRFTVRLPLGATPV